jgi:hypothetical protein
MGAVEALALCVCTGQWFTHEVRASGTEALAWLERFESLREHEYDQARRVTMEARVAGAPALSLSLSLRSHGELAEVTASIGGRELVLSNVREPPSESRSLLRRATIDETFALAARWLLGHDRIGCANPLEDAFWFDRAQVAAYVATKIDEQQLAALPRWAGAFFAWIEGTDDAGPRHWDVIETLRDWGRRNEAEGEFGWFVGGGAMSELQVAAVVERSSPVPGSR